jgi:hypothetical protein
VLLRGEFAEFEVVFLANEVDIAWLPVRGVVVGMVNLKVAFTFFVTDFTDETIFTFISSKEIVCEIMLGYLKAIRHCFFSPHCPFLHGLGLS